MTLENDGARPLRLLLVDDSAMMRAMIRRVIALAGVAVGSVREAANGRDALAILESEPVDVLFTDINMPVMTGLELLNEIEARRCWPALVRVVISTDGSIARREELRTLVHRYLVKPFPPEVVRDVLTTVVSCAQVH